MALVLNETCKNSISLQTKKKILKILTSQGPPECSEDIIKPVYRKKNYIIFHSAVTNCRRDLIGLSKDLS